MHNKPLLAIVKGNQQSLGFGKIYIVLVCVHVFGQEFKVVGFWIDSFSLRNKHATL